jgi:hypothetical protein
LIGLHFDAAVVDSLDRIELVNLTLQHLEVHKYISASAVDTLIDGYLIHALELGVKSGDDQVSYAWRATKYSSAFSHWPGLRELIEEAKSIGIPLDPFLADRIPQFV